MNRLAAVALLVFPAAAPAQGVDFNRDIRPILSEHCFACHGFDAKGRKAKLRLDVPEGALAERNGVVPLKPGSPKDSEVWARVTSADPAEVMPPPETNKTLTAAQKDTLRKWIEQGAKYQKHWAFEPPVRPAPPSPGHAVDAFLNARLAKEKLSPAGEADRETLIRRVSFALTGLPPTVAEVDQFLTDRTPQAYERMVDRYLASPRFGEEMARHWLDVARYADTHGLHLDNERQMWAYRDWVVKAFNQNLPFDKFTRWQLAGDLMPNPTADQLTATGFNRCNVTTSEGGSITAEWVYRYAVDRTATMMQTWLGLTGGCCQCHDHKYDPISQKEFYSLYAFFYSAADPGMDGNINRTTPFEKLHTPATKMRADAAVLALAEARKALETAASDYEPAPWADKTRVTDVILDDTFLFGAATTNTSRNPADWIEAPAFGAKSGRRVLRQANGYFYQDQITPQTRPLVVPASGAFEAWVRPDPAQTPAAVALSVNGKRVWWGTADAGGSKYAGGDGTRKGDLPPPGKWTKLSVPAAEVGLKTGTKVNVVSVQQSGGVAYWDAVTLAGEADPATDPAASFEAWRLSVRGAKALPGLPSDLAKAATAAPSGKPAAQQEAELRAFWRAFIARSAGPLVALRTAWESARVEVEAADAAVPGTMVFRDLPQPREAFVMLRGQYDKPGDRVEPDVPAMLPPLKTGKPGVRPTRLDLADWLLAPQNPLTARVAANRVWQQFFGTGLVKTSYDFGSQGDPPSHPELLDYLAVEFRETGWDVKRFLKLLVTSAAFRRDSGFTPELRQRDPENRLYARGPRFRLDAEQLRDNALAVSGLLNPEVGGRGVNVYQPPNIWEPVGYGDSNTRYYLQDRGPALHRRSLYVFLKRTAPPPFLVNFDAPNREQFCTVRDRTNTPLQALQLMNDMQHFEAARVLAERALATAGSDADRISLLYRTVLSRRPDSDELRVVSGLLAKQRELYRADLDAAAKAVRVGESAPKGVAPAPEVAAWAMVANLLLNLDETVNRN